MFTNLFQETDTTEEYKSIKYYPDGTSKELNGSVVKEHKILVYINEQLAMEIVCTPINLMELIVGRLISERLVRELDDIKGIFICENGIRAKVILEKNIHLSSEHRHVESCCTDNIIYVKNDWEDKYIDGIINKTVCIDSEMIFDIVNEANKDTSIHKKTSGTHSCYLFSKESLVFSCEDIGRHNAIDKAIGYMAIHELKASDCIIYSTGRIPEDMIRKIANAGLGVVVSKSVPTDKAIQIARDRGIVLIGRAWPDSYEIFC